MSDQEIDTDLVTTNLHIQPHEDKKEDDDNEVDTRVEINEDEDEKTDVKESQKPLLNEDEKNPEIVISMQDQDEENASPLPSKKGKLNNQDNRAIKPPSVFLSPFSRIKYDWENSQNLTFFTRVICAIFASVGYTVLVAGIPLMSIAQLIIGSIFVHDCPADDRIPRYLIISGSLGIVLHCISVCSRCFSKGAKDNFKVHRQRCVYIQAIFQTFLFIFFIVGCSWVYAIYEPDYVNGDRGNYCHKGLYLFTFWMFNLTFIFLLLVFATGIWCIAFDPLQKRSPEKNIIQK